MNKEEVVQSVKKPRNDERETQVMNKGYHISSVSIITGILVLMFLRVAKGDLFSQDLLFLIMLQVTTLGLYYYIKIKNPIYLATFFIGLIACGLTLINVLTYYGYIQ
ncbi:MAG: DUF6442 family protein [Bacillota bacterium]